MGLAAGQARLLTITGRKSDCEYQSMRLSHQKLALSRQLSDISNEYQNSLDQTKLIYDYYGKGDESNPLSYGILMNPSALNGYMPTIITDPKGRTVLNSKYAEAARAAGIPQEGLGTLPSEELRNRFVMNLCGAGLITERLSNTILSLPYNQKAGVGGGTTVAVQTASGSLSQLITQIKDLGDFTLDTSKVYKTYQGPSGRKNARGKDASGTSINVVNEKDVSKNAATGGVTINSIGLAALLSNKPDDQYYLAYNGISGEQTPVFGVAKMQSFLTDTNGFIDWLSNSFSQVFNSSDPYVSKALEYAASSTSNLVCPKQSSVGGKSYEELYKFWLYDTTIGKDTDERTDHKKSDVKNFIDPVSNQWCGKSSKDEKYQENCVKDSKHCIGFSTVNSGNGWGTDSNDHATAGINLNNLAKAFLTYFVDYMEGVSKTDSEGNDKYYVVRGALQEVSGTDYGTQNIRLVTDDISYQYTWKIGSTVSSDDLAQSTFYDALFNQLCRNGWTENAQIDDNEYLQAMLQNGMMYISKVSDDGYYYQGNYATDTYIKEIADNTKIAQAEAKYNTEKAKLNTKEETLDLKMKNLDTEISSLTTEYDTVKNTISKNIEKSFKRYNA